MTDNCKRPHVTFVEEDRISDLPEYFIDLILGQVPFDEAVRTSTLSKKWRYRWTTYKELCFCETFSIKYGPDRSIRIINQILTLLKGPSVSFLLHIPKIPLHSFKDVDECMLLLSKKGLRELVLINSNETLYELPFHVLSCQELKTLQLRSCLFKLPLEFKGSLNLEKLHLFDIDFGATLWGSSEDINLPQLKELVMCGCKNAHNFNIKPTILQILSACDFLDGMKLLQFLHNPCLTRAHISLGKPTQDLVRVEKMTFSMMLSNLPKIKHFRINNNFPKIFTAENIPEWLPQPLNSLQDLGLSNFQLGDLNELHRVLCLLRNSPNLKELYMIQDKMEPVVDVGLASNHLESPNCLNSTLSRLETVEIELSEGSRPELLFIKLLLAHSPSLKKFTIKPRGASDVQKTPDIANDVMQFPRASPKADVIYLNP